MAEPDNKPVEPPPPPAANASRDASYFEKLIALIPADVIALCVYDK